METITKSFYFRNLHSDIEWHRKLDGIISEGWKIIDTKPIGKTSIRVMALKSK